MSRGQLHSWVPAPFRPRMLRLGMRTVALFLSLAVSVSACSKEPSADAAAPAGQATSAAAAAQPAASGPAPAGPQTVTGSVLETMNAANYTYVRLKTGNGDLWAASDQFAVKVGDRVVVPLETPMENFHSASLNRDFPIIYFASRIWREGETPAAVPATAMPALASSHGPVSAGPAATPAGDAAAAQGGGMGGMMAGHGTQRPAPPKVEKLEPPAGGLSVADVWARRASLNGKTVTVRGTVVKFNGGILGRNWIHIQDGSGTADDGTHDLTITSDATVKVGDIVTVTGVLAVDKDFTAGYAYPVMLEQGKIVGR